MATPPPLKVAITRLVMTLIGLVWSVPVIFKLLLVTIRKRGANFQTVAQPGHHQHHSPSTSIAITIIDPVSMTFTISCQ